MKKQIFLLSLLAGLLTLQLSCSSDFPGYKKTKSGIYYKFHIENPEGKKAEVGHVLDMDMVYRTQDSILFDSRFNPQGMQLPLMEKQFDGDIYEALALLRVGDSATFAVDAVQFFTRTVGMPQAPDFIEPGSKMFFDVKLKKAQSQDEMAEERALLMEIRRELEPIELAEYLELNNITTPPAPEGFYFIEHTRGTGRIAAEGDRIKAHFFISTVNGEELYSSYETGEPLDVEIGRNFDNVGITEALKKVRKGTKATIIVPSEFAFGAEGRGDMVPPYTTMVYDVEVIDLVTKEQYQKQLEEQQREMERMTEQRRTQEITDLQNYIRNNNIQVQPTASGLYYIEEVKGTGPKPLPGQTVQVHYTGTLLNGSQFDSSHDRGQPFEFTLGAGQVIQGWDEGIAMMNEGGKAILIIPSKLGYGSRDMGARIPAYSTLKFEVELIGIK